MPSSSRKCQQGHPELARSVLDALVLDAELGGAAREEPLPRPHRGDLEGLRAGRPNPRNRPMSHARRLQRRQLQRGGRSKRSHPFDSRFRGDWAISSTPWPLASSNWRSKRTSCSRPRTLRLFSRPLKTSRDAAIAAQGKLGLITRRISRRSRSSLRGGGPHNVKNGLAAVIDSPPHILDRWRMLLIPRQRLTVLRLRGLLSALVTRGSFRIATSLSLQARSPTGRLAVRRTAPPL